VAAGPDAHTDDAGGGGSPQGGRPGRARASLSPLWSSRYVVADQAVASFSNFLLTALVGRWLGPADFGLFALVLASWLLVFGVLEAVVVDPMLVYGEDRGGIGRHVTAALLVGLAAAVPSVAAALYLGLGTVPGRTLLVLAVCLPVLVLQQLWRMVGFQRGRALASTVNDLVFLAVQVTALAGAFAVGGFGAPVATACWGLGALAGTAVGFWQFGGRFAPVSAGIATLRRGRAISDWLILDFFVNRAGLKQISLFVIAAAAGTRSVGALQAMLNLMGPTNILAFGAASAALVRGGAAMRAGDERAMAHVTRVHGLGLAAAVGLYGCLFAASSEWVVPAVYGTAYRPYVELAPFVALATVVYTLDLIPTVRLRIFQRTRIMFATRAGFAPICLACAWLLPAAAAITGVGLAAVSLAVMSTGGAWLALRRAARRSRMSGGTAAAVR
jgi:O-antigen/teichoic acid export membrane protein